MNQRPTLYYKAALAVVGLAFMATAQAQLAVSPQADIASLAASITGPGVRISNPTIDCHAQGYGEFSYTGSVLGLNEGVLLTSGRIVNAVGPNNASNRTFEQGTAGNALLNTVTGRTTYDACRLEFDVIPGGDTLRFNFALGSEEYNEWVGSQYNDVFGFFISGPGIVGDPGIGNERNIARIPVSGQAVTINNVNNGSNQAYFLDNAGGQHIQYDGVTQNLQAVAVVQPCQTYRLKLIVADASDRKFDSGVFIERIQSNGVTMESSTASAFPNVVEGCNAGTVRFMRQVVDADPLDVPYFLGGTATNGTDYPLIGNADPLVAKIATIPGNQSSVDIAIDAFADGLVEGSESIRVYLGSSECPGFYLDSLDFIVQDSLFATVSAPLTICPGQGATLIASGGLDYAWTPGTGLNTATGNTVLATPGTTTNYQVAISAGSCSETLGTTVTVSSIALTANTVRPLCHGQSNGIINLTVVGGTAPWSYSWTGPNGFTASTEDLSAVSAGTYTVVVTDGTGCTITQSFNLNSPAELSLGTVPSILPFGQNISCFGGADGSIDLTVNGGTAPYQTLWTGPNGFNSTASDLNGLAAGTYSITATDANGCTANGERTLVQPPQLIGTITANTSSTCFGSDDGSATVSIGGGIPPYNFSWNTVPVQNTPTATGLSAGTYSCTITDGYGCSSAANTTITAPAALGVVVTDVIDVLQCQGLPITNGSATAIASGGTAPYGFEWNTAPAQSGSDATFTGAGNYSVIVTDANGCTASAQVSIAQPGQSSIALSTQTDVLCAGINSGSATVGLAGGADIQSILWNTAPAQNGSTASGLAPGTYTATALHIDGCQSTASVTIAGPASPLIASIVDVQDVACSGDASGSASVEANGGTAPYTYTWNSVPPQSSAVATGLSAGTYIVTISDAQGCSTSAEATVNGPQAPLLVGASTVADVLCFGRTDGIAQASVTGGTAPYSYSWNSVPVQTTAQATDLGVGPYAVTVTDANGCTATANSTIDGPEFEFEAIIETFNHVTCFGANDGSATLTITGGSGSYSVTWNTVPPQSGPTASGLAPGDYLAAVVDNNGCDTTKFVAFTIEGPASPLELDFELSDHNGFNVSCADGSDGAIDVTVSGGYIPYSYAWNDAFGGVSGTEDLNGLDAGTYTLTVVDARGCVVDSVIDLNAPPPIVVDADITTAACQGSSSGAIDVTVSGGFGQIDATWTGPNGFTSNNADLTDLVAGVYTVTFEDANGCTLQRSYDISEPGIFQVSAVLSSYNGSWNVSCADATDGTIDLSVVGGTGSYAYAWTGTGIVDPTLEDQAGLPSGSYAVTITDGNQCSTLATFDLSAPEPLTTILEGSSYNGFGINCSGAQDGFITSTTNGGTALYDLVWTGPNGYSASTASIFSLASGTYTLLVTDANGCTTSASSTLSEPTPLTVSLTTSTSPSGNGIACAGGATGSIDLSVAGGALPYTIAWAGPDGYTAISQDISDLLAGTYAATIVDANGCGASINTTLTQPDSILISVTTSDYNGSSLSCSGASDGGITATVSGGFGVLATEWSGPNGPIGNTLDLTGLEAGQYTLTATDENGCTATSTVILEAPEPLTIDLTIGDLNGSGVSCAGASDGSIALVGDGGQAPYAIAWSGPNGFSSTEAILTDLEAGEYTAILSDANGCTTTTTATVSAPAPLSISLDPSVFNGGTNTSCSGSADASVDLGILGGSAPFTIAWSDGLGFTATSEDIANIPAGVYQVTVTDANGCTTGDLITLTSPQPLGLSAELSGTPGANVTCAGSTDGSIDLDIVGGAAPYSTVWSNGANGTAPTGLGAGTYDVVVSDANGCTATATYTLQAPDSVSIIITASQHPGGTAMACNDGTDGTLSATVSGGTPAYTYTWSGPDSFTSTDAALSNLGIGAYTLIVTDQNGCTGTATSLLDAPEAIVIDVVTITYNGGYQIPCMGEASGQLSTSVSGGQGDFTYAWSGPGGFVSTDADLSGSTAGTYQLVVTDGNGCTATSTTTLTEPDPLDLAITVSDAGGGFQIGCSGTDGSIAVTVTGGTPQYAYSWTGPLGFGSTESTISGLPAGTYHLTLTDANGCVFENNTTLAQVPELDAAFSTTGNSCPNETAGSITTTVSGGLAPYTLGWSGPDGFASGDQDISSLATGAYQLTITDALGCSASFDTEVTGPTPLVSGAYVSFYGQYNLQCVGDTSGVLDIEPAGGTAPYTIEITGPNGFLSNAPGASGLVAGDYAVNIIDANGCSLDTTITLTQPDLAIETSLTVSVYPSGTNVSCYGSSDGWIEASVVGGVGPYVFTWRGPDSLEFNTPNITGLPAGDYAYELVVTDGNQCSFFTEVTLTQPDTTILASVNTSSYNGGVQVSCADANDGSIGIAVQGGNGGFTLNWQGPGGFSASGDTLSGLVPGAYTATIIDQNGCTLSVDVPMNAPQPIGITLDAFTFASGSNISCANADDGSIDPIIEGGTQTYTLAWSGPDGFTSSDAQLTALAPGTYCLQVTDANGCVQNECTTLTAPDELSLITSTTIAACGQDVGSVTMVVNGGSAPYQHAWSNGATTQDISGLSPGSYTSIVTDLNGCTSTAEATVTGTPAVIAEGAVTNNLCNGGSEGSILLSVTSGVAPLTYLWSNGSNAEQLNDLEAGTYSVTITDANNCSYTGTFSVSQNSALVIDTLLSSYSGGYNVSTWGGSDGSIATEVSGGTAPYTYSWSNGSSTPDISGLPAGTYTLVVTDANGCTASIIVIITQPNDLIMPTGYSPNGDGANDNFFIQGLDAYPSNTFVVINRWGNVVYDRLNYRNDWNGENSSNEQLPNGTYFVILKVNDGERTLQGYVDLRR
jgi:gliding motility-associated-like protein